MSEYRAITITQGSGGFGGPLTVEPKEGKDVLLLSLIHISEPTRH